MVCDIRIRMVAWYGTRDSSRIPRERKVQRREVGRLWSSLQVQRPGNVLPADLRTKGLPVTRSVKSCCPDFETDLRKWEIL